MDLIKLIGTVGYVGVFGIIFAESGLLFGFFLPGDTLLLTVGLLASQGKLNLTVLLIGLPLAAIAGDQTGYWFGRQTGPRLFSRDHSLLFRKKNLLAARAFYDKHGGKTVMLARFVAFIRTFAPIVAGAAEMPYLKFLMFSVMGATTWTIGLTVAGYYLGASVPELDQYLLIIVLLLPVMSIITGVIHAWPEYRGKIFNLFVRRSAQTPPPAADATVDSATVIAEPTSIVGSDT